MEIPEIARKIIEYVGDVDTVALMGHLFGHNLFTRSIRGALMQADEDLRRERWMRRACLHESLFERFGPNMFKYVGPRTLLSRLRDQVDAELGMHRASSSCRWHVVEPWEHQTSIVTYYVTVPPIRHVTGWRAFEVVFEYYSIIRD